MHWLTIVPAVNLYTPAPIKKGSDVGICRGGSPQLVSFQVRVVGGVDEVMGKGLGHVLIDGLVLKINDWVILTSDETEKKKKRFFPLLWLKYKGQIISLAQIIIIPQIFLPKYNNKKHFPLLLLKYSLLLAQIQNVFLLLYLGKNIFVVL